ncbi:MAG: hypothetical protein Q9227_006048 [Pyrenula ochraceoflavens]
MASQSKCDRLDSDSTLFERGETAVVAAQDDSKQFLDISRPPLAVTKFQTERPPPMRYQPSDIKVRRMATEVDSPDTPVTRSTWQSTYDQDSSDSDSSSDNESIDEEHAKSRAKGGVITSRRHLNRTRDGSRQTRQPHRFDSFAIGNEQIKSQGKVSKTDGRLKIKVDQATNSGYIARALGAHIQHHLSSPGRRIIGEHRHHDDAEDEDKDQSLQAASIPKLNIVIMVIGSRGDVQPFLKIGRILKEKHGHRIRIATHPAFKNFVEKDSDLEFFSVGGDPSELMAFMVKNPGLLPSLETVMAGEIGRRRQAMYEMFEGFWRACINATDDEKDLHNVKMMGDKFSNVEANYTNYLSYPLVDLMTWQGLGDLVNRFRTKTLGLEPISTLWAPGQFARLRVNFTYLFSPGLVPKPEDWGPEIDIAGYVFLEGAESFKPARSLVDFLDGGEAIYIGFGSISGIDDPKAFTQMIFEAVEKANVRAVISKGWGGIGEMDIPSNVCLIDSVPHDWLFPRVSAVIHHGGAGTTAIGLKCGKPTLIVPFFGDQPFWAAMISRAGAGAEAPIPYKQLTSEKLAEGIRQCLSPSAKAKAQELADCIEKEGDGADNAVDAFHRSLPLGGSHSTRCFIFPDRIAVWQVKKTSIKLSPLAADLLVDSRRLTWSNLELAQIHEWTDFQGPGEPVTGAGGAVVASMGQIIGSLSSIPGKARRDIQQHETQKRHKKGKTVAGGAVLPGGIAQQVMQQRAPDDSEEQRTAEEVQEVNLQGKAAPTRGSKLVATVPKPPVLRDAANCSTQKEARNDKADPLPVNAQGQHEKPVAVAVAHTTARGVGHSMKALAKMPLDFYYAMTLGFHNAPRLYGDHTVRPTPHIYGMKSGLAAGRDGLIHGFSDGITGVVKLPYHEIKEDGCIGCFTGTGKGVGGLVLKPLAGVLEVGAYFGKGCRAEIRKLAKDTAKTGRWIRRARIIQGQKDSDAVRKGQSSDATAAQQKQKLEAVRTEAIRKWKEVTQREEELAAAEHRHSKVPRSATFSPPVEEKKKG